MRIQTSNPEDAPALSKLVDQVARERSHLAITTGFDAENTAAFIRTLQASGGVHLHVHSGDGIVGWCDICPLAFEGMRHVGKMGMGLAPEFRGQGLGRKLLIEAIELAHAKGLSRIELEVFSTNLPAIRLYETCGFNLEGRKVGVRRLDGVAADILIYAKIQECS